MKILDYIRAAAVNHFGTDDISAAKEYSFIRGFVDPDAAEHPDASDTMRAGFEAAKQYVRENP